MLADDYYLRMNAIEQRNLELEFMEVNFCNV